MSSPGVCFLITTSGVCCNMAYCSPPFYVPVFPAFPTPFLDSSWQDFVRRSSNTHDRPLGKHWTPWHEPLALKDFKAKTRTFREACTVRQTVFNIEWWMWYKVMDLLEEWVWIYERYFSRQIRPRRMEEEILQETEHDSRTGRWQSCL